MSTLRIVHLIYDEKGGAGEVVYNLVRESQALYEQTVLLYSRNHESEYGPRYQALNIRCFRIIRSNVCKFISDIRRAIRRLQPAIVVLHDFTSGLYGRLACWSLNVGIIVVYHGKLAGGLIHRTIDDVLTRVFSNSVVAVSEAAKKTLSSSASRKAVIIRNAVNLLPFLKIQPRVSLATEPVFTMIARLAPPKNQECLIRAASLLKEEGFRARFWIVGDGENRAKLVGLARQLEVEDVIEFWGRRDDIPRILKQSDFVVLISDFEGIPLSVLEGMVASRPVIASAVGGVCEIVEDKVTGWLVRRNVPEELAHQIKYVTEISDETRLSIVNRAKQYVLSEHNMKNVVRAWHKVIEKERVKLR